MAIKKPTHWRFKSREGERFGRLTVTSYAGKPAKGRQHRWNTVCDCGSEQVVQVGNLVTGNTKSCGCLNREIVSKDKRVHGESNVESLGRSAEYATWISMRQRCYDMKDKSYERYGGRGIRVCERWLSYSSFLADMGRRPSVSHSIDRIDNDGNYESGNCRWATVKEQSRNRRSNRILEHNGERKCLAEWAEDIGINRNALAARLKRGWSVKKTLTTPIKKV
jgi:hypothetical protein